MRIMYWPLATYLATGNPQLIKVVVAICFCLTLSLSTLSICLPHLSISFAESLLVYTSLYGYIYLESSKPTPLSMDNEFYSLSLRIQWTQLYSPIFQNNNNNDIPKQEEEEEEEISLPIPFLDSTLSPLLDKPIAYPTALYSLLDDNKFKLSLSINYLAIYSPANTLYLYSRASKQWKSQFLVSELLALCFLHQGIYSYSYYYYLLLLLSSFLSFVILWYLNWFSFSPSFLLF